MKKINLALSIMFLSLSVSAVEEDLGPIKVTEVRGNKDDKSFLQSNESISVLKTKNLNRGDVQNSVQMLNGFANVQTQNDKNDPSFSIRGVSDMGVTGFQKDNLASILVDDIFQTSLSVRAGSFENWDLESVEIHRGSQSTTQGVNSLAGNILLFHNLPDFENGGAAKLTLGNFGRREGAATLNRAITEKFAVRFSFNKEMSDGFIKNKATGNDKWGARNKDHLMADFLYKISASEDLRFNLKLLRMNRGGSYVQNNFKDYEVNENQDFKETTNNQQLGLTHTKRISDSVTNKLIIGATRGDSITKSDEDQTNGPSNAGTRRGSDTDNFVSVENQLKYKSEKIRNVLGIHLHQYYLNNFYDTRLLGTPTISFPVTQEDSKHRNTYALFNSFTYDFSKHHSANVGGRLEVVKNKFGIETQTQPGFPFPNVNGKKESTSTNTVALPKIGYNYHNNNYNLGATYSQGYRTGGISVNRLRATTSDYAPEKTHNYELSWKYVEKQVLVAANAFYTKWKDQQVQVQFSNQFDTEIQNAANSELYGAEVETSYLFSNADSVRLNVGYVHTQFMTFNTGSTSFTGNQFPNAAPVTAQLSYWKVVNDSWRIIYVSRYVAESYTNANNDRHAPEQFYSDINGQYNFDQYMLELYVRNIFDQQYRLLNGAPRSAATPYQASNHLVSAPREFGVRLNYFW